MSNFTTCGAFALPMIVCLSACDGAPVPQARPQTMPTILLTSPLARTTARPAAPAPAPDPARAASAP
jgi:hypothetical protein